MSVYHCGVVEGQVSYLKSCGGRVGWDVTAVGCGLLLLHSADVLLGVVESLLGAGHFEGCGFGECVLYDVSL